MIVVIQCAAGKRRDAGSLRTRDGRPVLFVANPAAAPARSDLVYARPDEESDQGGSWRDALIRYNEKANGNPLSLCQAIDLYANETYRALGKRFGRDQIYILSAGWGLIPSSFLTPYYDITFSASAEQYKRRRTGDAGYRDLSLLSKDSSEEVVFLGGRDYLPLFCHLTAGARCRRTIFYNSDTVPYAQECRLVRFATKTRTNWHYECARALLNGNMSL